MASRSKKKFASAQASRTPAGEKSSGHLTDGDGSMTRLQGLLIVAVGIWIFSPVLRGDWLWDDYKLITRNALMLDPAGFWKVLVRPDGLGNYDPLTSEVRWLQWQCWGDNPLGYHLTSVGLHLISAFLIWRLFYRLRLPCAWFGALIFTVHPLMVESVAWITELKNTLSLPPLLLAMLGLLAYDEGGRRRADYFQALGWFGVAMLVKTAGMMLPVVFLGYVWLKRRKIGWSEIKASVPFFIVALAAGWMSVSSQGDPSKQVEIVATGGWAARLATLGWAGLFLLGKALFPVGLMPAYPGNAVEMPSAGDILPWLLLGGALGLVWSRRETWGLPVLAGLGFFLVNLVPVFGFIAINYATMVWSMDHLVYLPIIGLIGLFATGVGVMMERLSAKTRPVGMAAMALTVALLAVASHEYAVAFSDEETLWRCAVERDPDFYLAQENLGKALLLRGQPEEAKTHFDEVLRLKPRRAASYDDLGKALVQMGRVEDGIAEYRQALSRDPTDWEVENNLGVALIQLGKVSEAVGHFQQAVRIKPDYTLAYDNLGGALALTGQIPEAMEQFKKALEIDPGDAKARDSLAKLQQLQMQQNAPGGN
jgi:Flp pilus assembly protein TadD